MSEDLIKRADAIDELMHIIPYKRYHNGEYVFLLNKRECLKAIKAIPTADREWIPCSERLPEERTQVLVQADDMYHTTDTNNGILTGWRRGDYWYTFTICGCETIRYPLAWMPLPRPYKQEEDLDKCQDQ